MQRPPRDENKEKFYTFLNRQRPGTTLRPLQKVLVYAYLQITNIDEREEVLDLLDEYEENGRT